MRGPRPVSRTGTRTNPAARKPGVESVKARVKSAKKRPAARPATKRVSKPRTVHRKTAVRKVVQRQAKRLTARPRGQSAGRMAAAVRYALAQVGKPYVFGATGPRAYDCSGLTQAAYRRAGIRLPHQSGAQAARAHRIPRSQARPGDLVVGPGHVGIVVGWRGGRLMMVDAGNRRVGVVYRAVYRGLWVERLSG